MAAARKKTSPRPSAAAKPGRRTEAGPEDPSGRLLANAHFRSTDRVLELGCEESALAFAIARLAGYVTGVAFCEETLVKVQDKRLQSGIDNVSFQRVTGTPLPFGNRAFDVVVSYGILHRLEQPEQVVREMVRVLNSPGRLYLADIIGAEDAAMREAHLKIEKTRYGSPATIFSPSEFLTLLADDPLEIIARNEWTERVKFEQWMPPEESSASRRDKLSRMLHTAARKKTTDLKIKISGKSISFERRWMLLTAEKTGDA
jgi:SAM-dependent methyltransferase